MDRIVDKLNQCTLRDKDDGFLTIQQHVLNKDFTKVFAILKTLHGVGDDLAWHKKVGNVISESFAETDVAWDQNDKEPVLGIMEHFMEWLNKAPAEFSSLTVFVLIFHANRRLLRTAGTWDYQLQSRLLDLICHVKFPSGEDYAHRIRSFRSTMYAVTWNQMRENFKTIDQYTKTEMMIMSCRWLMFDSMENITKVGKKFSGTVAGCITAKPDANMNVLILTLLTDICTDYGNMLEKEIGQGSIKLGNITGKCILSQALVEFAFGCLMIAQRSSDSTIASVMLEGLLNVCYDHFSTVFLRVLEAQMRLVIQVFEEIYDKKPVCVAAQKLQSLRTTLLPKLHSPKGSGELASDLLTCFFQAIVSSPPWRPDKRCEDMTVEHVAKLATELVTLLPEQNRIKLSRTVNMTVNIAPDVVVNYIIFIIRIVADKLSRETCYISKIMVPIRKCMDSLSEFIPQLGSGDSSTDINYDIGHSFYNLSTALQKAGRYEESLDICKKCVESFTSLPKEKLTMHPHFYCNIMTQTYLKLEEHEAGLDWLSKWLLENPATLDEHVGSFDLFNLPSCSEEWSAQWVRVKYEAKSSAIQQLTVYEFLNGVPGSEEIMNAALLLELNSYLSCKCVLGDAIATVGEHLADIGRDACEKALGHLAQAIGFSWDDKDTNEEACIRSCEYALELLNNAIEEEKNGMENPQLLIMCAIAKAWLAFCYMKRLGTIVKMDLESLQDEEKENDPKQAVENKGHDLEPDPDRIVPGISSLDLNNEHEFATLLMSCIDSLFTIISFEESEVKKWLDICPALILLTARLCAYKVAALNETFSAIRAWHVCYVMAKLYNRKYIQLLAGIELCKLTSLDSVPPLEELEELIAFGASKGAKNYMPPAFFARLDLLRATVALRNKNYSVGVKHLTKVLTHRTEKSNLDATHLVFAEVYFLLAQYRIAQESNNFSLQSIETDLAHLTPSALIVQAYKLCIGIIRPPNPASSGWQDLFYNQQLMLVLFEYMPKSLEIFKEAGNVKELMSYGSDLILLSQCFGFISRSMELLLALAEADILSRQFETADEKVDAIYRMISNSDVYMGVHRVEMSKESLAQMFKKYETTTKITIPNVMPHLKINLQRPETISTELESKPGTFAEPKSPTLMPRMMSLPKYLFHGISCSCYVCLHPKIIPNTIKFFQMLIRIAAYTNDPKTAMLIVPVVRVHHNKACFRIVSHFERMTQRLSQAFQVKSVGREALERAYLPFFYEPGIHLLYTMAEFAPVSEIEFIIKCAEKIKAGLELSQETDAIANLGPLELVTAALFEHYFAKRDSNLIRKSDIRTVLQQVVGNP